MKIIRVCTYILTLFFGLTACQATFPVMPASSTDQTAGEITQVATVTVSSPQPTVAAVETTTTPPETVEPTASPAQVIGTPSTEGQNDLDTVLAVTEIPVVGTPGRYVNIAFGYVVQYPEAWFTGFGSRPMLASFSNLDPGGANRESMRATGCLIEVMVAPNVYGFTLQTLLAQLPQTYEDAETFQLSGEDAVRVIRDNENLPYITDTVQVVHDGRLFTIVADMARSAEENCRAVWDDVLNQWTWFTPDFVPYRNSKYGYSISYPRSWSVIDSTDQSIVVASQARPGTSLDDMAREGIVVQTSIVENLELLPLKQWVATNVGNLGLTNDIELDTLRGIRSVRVLDEDIQQMSGYFQGPLGKIYIVDISYPDDRQREFRPYANAVIYSFGF